ncbi:MAG: hypothetical protein ABIJ59_09680 [Pseudomonadota bacterium]
MIDEKSKNSRFLGLFFLGNFIFCYPILTLFNSSIMVLGIPVLFLFLFSAWLGLICLMIVGTEISPRILLNKPTVSEDKKDLQT